KLSLSESNPDQLHITFGHVGTVKTEVCGEPASKGQTHTGKSSCPTPMETNQTNGIANNNHGLDSRTNKIKQIVEDAISPDSKLAVMRILDQVNELSTAEKLLLYLKLPTGKSGNLDPLKQPLNPLGSRFEIHQTITWIKTHLEEDQDISLPKQDVYDEYIAYCNSNAMKPLSTADFGKVMKQVFPRVRPRRLGTRGNSRYCYAGMRKKMKLEAPLLPDLGEETKSNSGSCTEDDVMSAASCLIREWAEKLLGIRFESLRDLACHLVDNMCVDSRSVAAFTVLSGNKTAPNLCTVGKVQNHISHVTIRVTFLHTQKSVHAIIIVEIPKLPAVGGQNKHRETQLQLQRKLQEREVIREQKRKLQEQAAAAVVNKTGGRGKAKLSTNIMPQGETANCDKSTSPPAPDKLPIPRLANQTNKQLANVIILPNNILNQKSPKKKYKPIQPKPDDKEVSIGCLEKDALDDYNSQEQEEELMRYFQHQNSSSSNEEVEEKSDKLTQLRQLLESNLESTPEECEAPKPQTSTASSSQRIPNRPTGKPALLLPSNGNNHPSLSSRRRVSFETCVMETTVPPSPNTRRRIFSFTPISPGPHSPLGAQRTSSKPSSANASPFVSPRNTPVPRSRHNSGQATYQNRLRHSSVAAKVVRSNSVNSHYQPPRQRAPEMFVMPTGPPPMSPLSISAPQSPMISFQSTDTNNQLPETSQSLLQAVLQPKTLPTEPQQNVTVNSDPLSQEVSRFFSDSEPSLVSVPFHRSQSVPLHRMTSALESPQYNTFNIGQFSGSNSVVPTPVPSEFTDFISTGGESSTAPSTELLGDDGTDETPELNSENLNRIFNLLDDVQEHQQLSLTLDVDIAQNGPKFIQQPSRSYPNTPLPYTRDPIVSSFAASLPRVVFGSSENGSFQQELSDGQQITLNSLNIRTTARRNINSLLEQTPFSVDDQLTLDTLEALEGCDTLTQFVQEVNGTDHITD
ncbi:hypothetical protein L9F63_021413, partial [Diploptera punctata]